jgi:hypothetical protein
VQPQWRWWRWAVFHQFLQLMEHQWNEIDRGKPKTRRKTCSSATLSTTNLTWTWPGTEPRASAVRGRRLTAWAMTRPAWMLGLTVKCEQLEDYDMLPWRQSERSWGTSVKQSDAMNIRRRTRSAPVTPNQTYISHEINLVYTPSKWVVMNVIHSYDILSQTGKMANKPHTVTSVEKE